MRYLPWVIERAKQASRRWQNSSPGPDEETRDEERIVRLVFRHCFGRQPDPLEVQACREFLRDSAAAGEDRLADLIQSFFASIDFRYLD